MGFGTCRACGAPWRETMTVEDAKEVYGEAVYNDFKERNYKDYNAICEDCLKLCKRTLNKSKKRKTK